MATEIYTNDAAGTVAPPGGTTATGGTETWTVTTTSAGPFPAAVTGVSQFHVADPASLSELIAVTNVSGTTWTVTRGAEGTGPVAHAAGFTVQQVVTAAALTSAAVKSPAANSIIYVTTTGSDTNDGLSWGTAKLTIAAAVNAINALGSTGGQILLGEGAWVITTPMTDTDGTTAAVILQHGTVLEGISPALTNIYINCTAMWGILLRGAWSEVRNLEVRTQANANVSWGLGVEPPQSFASAESCCFTNVGLDQQAGWMTHGFCVAPMPVLGARLDVGTWTSGSTTVLDASAVSADIGQRIFAPDGGIPATATISALYPPSGPPYTGYTISATTTAASPTAPQGPPAISGGSLLYVGGTAFNPDVAQTKFVNCHSYNEVINTPANAGTGASFQIGNGTPANILDHAYIDCASAGWNYGIYAQGTTFSWYGGSIQKSWTSDIFITQCNQATVQGFRNENSARLLMGSDGGSQESISIKDIVWGGGQIAGFPQQAPFGDYINFSFRGLLVLENLKFTASIGSAGNNTNGGQPWFTFGSGQTGNQMAVVVDGLYAEAPLSQLFSANPAQNMIVSVRGYVQGNNATGGAAAVPVIPGPVTLVPTSSLAYFNTYLRDIMLPADITFESGTAANRPALSGTAGVWNYVGYYWATDTYTLSHSNGTAWTQIGISLAGDLGGTLAVPRVTQIQGQSIDPPSGGSSSYLNAAGHWAAPPGTAGGTLPGVTAPSTTASLGNVPAAAFCTTSGTAYTVTLGDATVVSAGMTQTVVKTTYGDPAGIITVTAQGTQTIGGYATSIPFKLFSGGDRLEVMSDGANWQVVGYQAADLIFTSTVSNWAVPAGWALIDASVVGGGAGGSGGGTPATNIACSGAPGGSASIEVRAEITIPTPGMSLALTVGSGGAEGTGATGTGSGGVTGGQGGQGTASTISGSGIVTVTSGITYPSGGGSATATNANATPWGQSQGGAGTMNSTAAYTGGTGALGGYAGGKPIGLASGAGGSGGPSTTTTGGGAGSPGTPAAGGAAGASGGNTGSLNGASGADAASTSYGAGGGGGGAGVFTNSTTYGNGGNGGKGGPGIIILRRRG